jgi:hypothetical protein
MATQYDDLSIRDLIHRLESAGRYPSPELIRAIYERREEAEQPVLGVFEASLDDDWPSQNDPRWYRFRHAGSLLIGWRTEAAIPIFSRIYREDETQDLIEVFEEDPANFGPPAISQFAEVLQAPLDEKGWHYGASMMVSILARIAMAYPESREEVLAVLRARLPAPLPARTATEAVEADEEYDGVVASIVHDLGALRDQVSKDHIMALFAAGQVDPNFLDRANYLQSLRGEHPIEMKPYDVIAEYASIFESAHKTPGKQPASGKQVTQQASTQPAHSAVPKVGRNDPCPCGSGQKYKRCHGKAG